MGDIQFYSTMTVGTLTTLHINSVYILLLNKNNYQSLIEITIKLPENCKKKVTFVFFI